MSQATLFNDARKPIQESFEEWLSRHGDVYRRFVQLAREAKRRGRTRWSTKAMIEVYRWECEGDTDPVDGFKLSDHYSSRLARKIMDDNPDLAGFFETRKLKAV